MIKDQMKLDTRDNKVFSLFIERPLYNTAN